MKVKSIKKGAQIALDLLSIQTSQPPLLPRKHATAADHHHDGNAWTVSGHSAEFLVRCQRAELASRVQETTGCPFTRLLQVLAFLSLSPGHLCPIPHSYLPLPSPSLLCFLRQPPLPPLIMTSAPLIVIPQVLTALPDKIVLMMSNTNLSRYSDFIVSR